MKTFLSIRTRLMAMLLGVSLLACLALGVLGSRHGQRIIVEEVTEELRLVRAAKKSEVEAYFDNIAQLATVLGQNEQVEEAAVAFRLAYDQLYDEKLNAECSQALSSHYEKFVTKLSENVEVRNDLDIYMPRSVEGCYLQNEYIVENPNPIGNKDVLVDPRDGTQYAAVHRRYHAYFRLLVEQFNFYDIFLIDLEKGNIVYSVFKETDFGTNLYSGPYRNSNLADLARRLRNENDLQVATFEDFASYRPSYGAPAAFVGIPLVRDGESIGALVFQFAVGELNRIMTFDGRWAEKGLGESGEVYLVGEDFLMRSASRFFLEDSLGYVRTLLDKGARRADIDRMYRYGSTILQQRVRTESTIAATEGNTDVRVVNDYRGVPVISAYAPLQLPGLNWAILAEQDEAEAYAPITAFNQRIFIITAILMGLVTLLAMWLAGRFVRPIEQLLEGTRRIRAGDLLYRVKLRSNDEFDELGTAFNGMVEDLEHQTEQAQQQAAHAQALLANSVPEIFIERLLKGERGFADNYSNVSLVLIDLVGFSQWTERVGADASVKLLNQLMEAFDESAKACKVERIKTMGDTYLAACGLFESRLDHARRVVQFAQAATQLIDQVNLNHRLALKVHISIHSGELVAGIVGRERFTFDVWGPTVNQVFRMNDLEEDDRILVSAEVESRLRDYYRFHRLERTLVDDTPVFYLGNAVTHD